MITVLAYFLFGQSVIPVFTQIGIIMGFMIGAGLCLFTVPWFGGSEGGWPAGWLASEVSMWIGLATWFGGWLLTQVDFLGYA